MCVKSKNQKIEKEGNLKEDIKGDEMVKKKVKKVKKKASKKKRKRRVNRTLWERLAGY